MAPQFSPLAYKLATLAEDARQLQLETGTTAPSLEHLPAEHTTTRQTISALLTYGKAQQPQFVFHREPMAKKPPAPGEAESPTVYRAAVFGGGVESTEEKRLRELADTESLFVDPDLLNEEGECPPDAWYRLQGKHFLQTARERGTGSLLQMEYPMTPEVLQEFLREQMRKRLQMEVHDAVSLIGEPEPLYADPVETPVLNRRLGNYTEDIARATGMEVNDKEQLVGIGILVQERFAIAELLTNPEEFAERSGGNALVWPADKLVAIAERDTKDVDAWLQRLQHQESDDDLPLRNHSALVGAAAAAQHLQEKSSVLGRMKRAWSHLRKKSLSVAA